jgi:hypothetical protein
MIQTIEDMKAMKLNDEVQINDSTYVLRVDKLIECLKTNSKNTAKPTVKM